VSSHARVEPEPAPLPEKVLVKAAGEGRIRGIALETWADGKADVWSAGSTFRDGLRQARSLHSRERRLVRDALYSMVRNESRWAFVLGTDEPLVMWLAGLVEGGLPVAAAQLHADAPFGALLDGSLEQRLERLEPWEALAVRHGLPGEVVQELVQAYGVAGTSDLLRASDARAPVTIRANVAENDRDTLAELLGKEGVVTQPCVRSAVGLQVVGAANLMGTRAHSEGWFEVQDEGSQLLAEMVPADARVVDFCAGAGGKSLAMAARGSEVMASDVRRGALKELSRRAERAGVHVPTVVLPDEGDPPEPLFAFEPGWVLVDAPCSGVGVLRRHPEHRWHLDPEVLERRGRLQRAILDRAEALVPEDGTLVYATCSLLPSENQAVVADFLAAHPDFEAVGPAMLVAPHTDGTDGFFAQALQRSHRLQSTALRSPR
jgi:16S rRNA (cytosine967-C5)-methyltransferase